MEGETMTLLTRAQMCALMSVAVLAFVLCSWMPVRAAELLMFETRGCPWCAAWHREVGPGYPKSTEGQRAPLRRLDLADTTKAGVTLATPITASPTFVLVDKGREIGRITGYPGADFFWGLLAQLITKLEPQAGLNSPTMGLLQPTTDLAARTKMKSQS
jgi:hypothetical protein